MNYDLAIFQAINGLAGHSRFTDAVGIFLAEYLAYVLGVWLLVLLLWPRKSATKNKTMVLLALIAGLIARFAVKGAIVLFYHRPRPYVHLPLVHKLISMPMSENFQSFPSGHAIFFFALSTVVYYFNKKLGVIFFIFAVLMGIARVFVGVHWPSDILGGAILGILVGLVVTWFYKKYESFFNHYAIK
jgi:undecaprenyl-diphosphatase